MSSEALVKQSPLGSLVNHPSNQLAHSSARWRTPTASRPTKSSTITKERLCGLRKYKQVMCPHSESAMQETLLTGSHLKKPEFHTRNCCSQLAILGSRLLTH